MTFPATKNTLGYLPLQDHRPEDEVEAHLRTAVWGYRLEKRDTFGRYVGWGDSRSEKPKLVRGDLRGGFFIHRDPKAKKKKRKVGIWSFALPSIVTEGSDASASGTRARVKGVKAKGVQPKAKLSKTKTRGSNPSSDQRRKVKIRPIYDRDWTPDERLEETEVFVHPDSPAVSKGSLGIVLQGIKEDRQDELFFPISSGALVAVNRGRDAGLSTEVYDTDQRDELDELHSAPLHGFWRTVKIGVGITDVAHADTLAWQLGLSGRDRIPGRGMVIDSPSAPITGIEPADESEQGESSETEKARYGKVTFIGDYLKEMRARIKKAQGEEDKDRTSRSRTGSNPSSGQAADNLPDPQQVNPGAVLAAMSSKVSGPIDVGSLDDPHRIAITYDQEAVNVAHIQTGALYRGGIGDGPLDFEGRYEDDFEWPFQAECHLRWDASKKHRWVGGSAIGRWRIQAETPIYIPEEEEDDPPPPPPEKKKGDIGWQPPWKPLPPAGKGKPKRGPGGVEDHSGSGITVGGGGQGGEFVPGAPDFRPFGPGSCGEPDGPSECQTLPGPRSGGQDGTGAHTGDDEAPWSPTGGTCGTGVITGPAPNDARTKVSTGTGATGGPGRQVQKYGSRFRNLEGQLGLPIGTLSTSGARLSPEKLERLIAKGVLDQFGKPTDALAKVGDSPKRVRDLLGGVESQTPTFAAQVRAAGGMVLRAFATTSGEDDMTRGGFIRKKHLKKQQGAPDTATMVGHAVGTGGWGGWSTVDSPRSGRPAHATLGSAMLLPSLYGNASGLGEVLDGDFDPTSETSSSPRQTTSMVIPGRLSKLVFGYPSRGALSGAGTSLAQAEGSGALLATVLDAAGDDTSTTMQLGSAGVLVSGGTAEAPGHVLTDINGGSSSIPSADAGVEYDGTVNVRPLWKEDSGTGDDAQHALAYASDVPTGFSQTVVDNEAAVQGGGFPAIADVKSLTVPAGTLAANGDRLIVRGVLETSATAASYTLAWYWGGVSLFSTGPAIAVSKVVHYEITIERRGATSQYWWIRAYRAPTGSANGNAVGATYAASGTASATLSGTVTFKTRGIGANATSITDQGMAVDYHPAA